MTVIRFIRLLNNSKFILAVSKRVFYLNKMKGIIKKILGKNKEAPIYRLVSKIYKKYSPYVTILTNTVYDAYFYCRHSNVFSDNTLNKMEAKIILDYHSIEKGLLFQHTRFGFAKEKVNRLHKYLRKEEVMSNVWKSQIKVAYRIMCEYYEIHKKNNFDTSTYFTLQDYESYKTILGEDYNTQFSGVLDFDIDAFYNKSHTAFDEFSDSRKSLRNFTGELVDDELIEKAVELSKNAPSVCNRQTAKVYYVKNKNKIDRILEVQAGLNGFSENIRQLLVITTDVNYFYLVGERYQFYIDGGIYLMNLLYALHFYSIGACPANWAKEWGDEKRIRKIIPVKPSEKVICVVAIGIPENSTKATLSQRRELDEILTIIED